MTKETANTFATPMSQSIEAGCDRVPGAVVRPAGRAVLTSAGIMNHIGVVARMAGTVFLVLLWCGSAAAFSKNGNGTISTNGSAGDVQAAITAASAGSVVLIPSGQFSWTSQVVVKTDVSVQGAGAGNTTITDADDNLPFAGMLAIANPTPFACSVSGITFNGNSLHAGNTFLVQVLTPALIHDNAFLSNGGLLDQMRFVCNGGVVWNCTFYDYDGNEEGITFQNSAGGANGVSPDWTTGSTLGILDASGTLNTYIEDCTFVDMALQAMDLSDNSRVVVRHCTFNNSSIVSHGLDTGPYGTRQWEIYENNFVFTSSGTTPAGGTYPLGMNWWFYVRGGTGVIWGNVMPDLVAQQLGSKSSILLTVWNIRRTSAYIPCQTAWLALHQVGQGYQSGLVSDPVYIWSNSGGTIWERPGIGDWQPDQCGNGQVSDNYIKLNRDYIVGTVRPGYKPYTYPHPVRAGGFSRPAPPKNLRVEK
jgi:hypothetical protein